MHINLPWFCSKLQSCFPTPFESSSEIEFTTDMGKHVCFEPDFNFYGTQIKIISFWNNIISSIFPSTSVLISMIFQCMTSSQLFSSCVTFIIWYQLAIALLKYKLCFDFEIIVFTEYIIVTVSQKIQIFNNY